MMLSSFVDVTFSKVTKMMLSLILSIFEGLYLVQVSTSWHIWKLWFQVVELYTPPLLSMYLKRVLRIKNSNTSRKSLSGCHNLFKEKFQSSIKELNLILLPTKKHDLVSFNSCFNGTQ